MPTACEPGLLDAPAQPWLRGPAFDLGLIVGVFILALVLGGVASISFGLFLGVLYLDFWLLAYPHVASTYTRIAFDRASARRHWFLLLGLPPLVFAATASVSWFGGVVALNTIYFCWQSWHYTRQSHGIARAYRRAALPGVRGHDRLSECVVFGFPVWGLLHRAHQRPEEFYASPIAQVDVPGPLVVAAGVFAIGALSLWTLRQLRPGRHATSGAGHALFVLSHVAITTISYLAISDITAGWLFINIWHNAQYLLFVWAQNARRFRGGREPARPFLSWLCQPAQRLHYAAICLALGGTFYFLLGLAADSMAWQTLPLVLICHQTVNFHHYIVDAVIWRSPRPAPAR
jgi:hypothetical protein